MSSTLSDNEVTPRFGGAGKLAGFIRRQLTSDIATPMSMFPGTKDISYHPLFRGQISRFVWKLMVLTVTPAGRWFMVTTLFVAAAASIELTYQQYVPFCFFTGIWLAAILYHLFSRPAVSLKVRHSDRISVGEVLPVDVDVTQSGSHVGADLTLLAHGLPPMVDAVEAEGVRLPILRPRETARVRLGLLCRKRGQQQLKGYRIESDFPFGLLRTYRVHYRPQPLLVYPRFHPLARLTIPSGRRYHPGGVALASNLGESFEFLGNREYQDGDNVRDIDWHATARVGRPIIREYREEYFLRVGVVLDTHVRRGEPARSEDFERAVSMAAAVSDYMSRQDYIVDLFAAGPNLYHLTAGRSLAYLDQILDILACVDETRVEPFETLEPAILENLSKITTVICIFLDWNETRRAFVERIAQAGNAVKVMVVRDSSTTANVAGAFDLAGYVPVIGRVEFERGIEEL